MTGPRTPRSRLALAGLAVCVSIAAGGSLSAVDDVTRGASPGANARRVFEPVDPGGRTPTLPASPTSPTVYTVELERFDVSNDGTRAIATTRGLDDAIEWAAANGFDTVELPLGTYLIGEPGTSDYHDGIQLVSGITLDLGGSTLQMDTNDKWNQCLVSVRGLTDVTIRNGTLVGDRDTHVFTPRADGETAHEEGHLICVRSGSRRVLIDDLVMRDATGDAILLVGSSTHGSVRDITIRDSEIDRSRRQGVSVVGAINVLIENNEIHHIVGTPPQFGIDVESRGFESRDLIFRGNHFHHNFGGDIVNTDGANVLIEHNRFEEGEGHRNLDGPMVFWRLADQTIRHNTFRVRNGSVNGKVGIIGYAGRFEGPRPNPALNWIYDNHCDGCGLFLYETSGFRVMRNTFDDGYIVMRDVDDLVLVDNEVNVSSDCRAYRFLRVDGFARGNMLDGRAVPLPMRPGTRFDRCWHG